MTYNRTDIDLESLLNGMKTIARETALFIETESKKFDAEKIRQKAFNQLVSYVDEEAEKMIVKGLKEILPEAGFITEENTTGQNAEQTSKWSWVIDPLDGTTNFVHGIPFYSVSMALAFKHEPMAGLIYHVGAGEMFYACKGKGAFLNGKSIKCSQNNLSSSLIATGFPFHSFDNQEKYLKIFGAFMRKCRGMRRMGSAALDLAYVAAGRFDGFFEYDLNIWDVAAGIIILQEAGGKSGTFEGMPLQSDYSEILASNELVWKEMINLIEKSYSA